MRVDSWDIKRKGAETHNYGSLRERGIAMPSWAGTYRFYVMKHSGVDPDDVQHGGVPILQHSQARRDLRYFRMLI